MPDIYAALAAMARRAARETRAAAPTDPEDDVIADTALLIPWEPGNYAVGNVRVHAGQPWRCCQAHDSTGNDAWTPGATPAVGPVSCHIRQMGADLCAAHRRTQCLSGRRAHALDGRAVLPVPVGFYGARA